MCGIAGGFIAPTAPTPPARSRRPTSRTTPASHSRSCRTLHHCIVDRFRGCPGERVDAERDEAEGRRNRGRGRRGAVRLEALILVKQEARAEHEIARVPQIALGQ
jgi:hypothetical protein